MTAPLSPCIKLCVIDPQSQTCTGCYRTLSEIAAWGSMTNEQRRAVMDTLAARADGMSHR